MSDNLPPEVVQEELEARLRIPTEVWTDVFKLLPRRVLVRQIDSVCYYFKEISNKNVKNVHVIENARQFEDKLKADDPDAIKQLEHLKGHDCQLANQYRLAFFWISEKSQTILSHCPDLLNGCQIALVFREENKDSKLFSECLDKLEKAKPVVIYVSQFVDQVVDYWRHPTILNCSRILFHFWPGLSAATVMKIFDWLHHQPSGVDCDDSADQQVRGMIVWGTGHNNHIDWLINRCAEDVQQARGLIHRRQFVFSFFFWDWSGFGQFRRIKNKSTGEVLVLDRVIDEDDEQSGQYRLRRCLVEEETGGQETYAAMFNRDQGLEDFNVDEKTPEVIIE